MSHFNQITKFLSEVFPDFDGLNLSRMYDSERAGDRAWYGNLLR